jgi:hypothetical protein
MEAIAQEDGAEAKLVKMSAEQVKNHERVANAIHTHYTHSRYS